MLNIVMQCDCVRNALELSIYEIQFEISTNIYNIKGHSLESTAQK